MSDSLWDFSQDFYGITSHQHALLSLQETQDADVVMLLFLLWYAKSYGEIPEDIFSDARVLSFDWNKNVVKQLRSTRVWLKQAKTIKEAEPLKEQIKTLELAAEKLQIDSLEQLCQKTDHKTEAVNPAFYNLQRYLSELPRGDINHPDVKHLLGA